MSEEKKYDITAVLNKKEYTVTGTNGVAKQVIDARQKEGLGPLESLLNGLAACELLTANAYAQQQNIVLDKVMINITGARSTEVSDGYFGLRWLNIVWEIYSPNSPEEIKNFIDFVSERCPAHSTLGSSKNFEIKVAVTLVK